MAARQTRPEVTREMKLALAVVAALPAIILASATLCTWAVSAGASADWKLLFRTLCHGRPDRALELFGAAMPLCARCTGLYAGMLFGLLVFPAMKWLRERTMRSVAFASVTPLAIDGLTQLTGLRESTNSLRIATGVIAGFAFGLWVLSAARRRNDDLFTTS